MKYRMYLHFYPCIYNVFEKVFHVTYFTATKTIAEKYHNLKNKLQELLQYIYDPNSFPENFITITEVTSEIIQQLKIDHSENNCEITTPKTNHLHLQTSQN